MWRAGGKKSVTTPAERGVAPGPMAGEQIA